MAHSGSGKKLFHFFEAVLWRGRKIGYLISQTLNSFQQFLGRKLKAVCNFPDGILIMYVSVTTVITVRPGITRRCHTAFLINIERMLQQMAEIGQNAGYTIPLQINGQEIRTNTTFKVVNPGTNNVLWKCSSASRFDALQAAEAAQRAFAVWSRMKASARRDIFLRAADVLASRAEELAEYVRLETGATEPWAAININGSIEQLRDVAGRVMNVVGQVPLCSKEDRSAMVLKEPYGVVLGIAPWYKCEISSILSVIGSWNL